VRALGQVEDTLNNSNDLFLTFRKEMEEMSKKTKKLEDENDTLRRKHDRMKLNIVEMAEEQQKHMKDLDASTRREDRLKSIIQQMQQQGRGLQAPNGAVTNGTNGTNGHMHHHDVGEESEYDYANDSPPSDTDADYGDDEDGNLTEEEQTSAAPRPFGPVPPPAMETNRA
jgi:NADH:ubiquinone oxidoreductase subunit D